MHFEPLPYVRMYSKYRDFHCCTVVLVCSDNQNDIILAIICTSTGVQFVVWPAMELLQVSHDQGAMSDDVVWRILPCVCSV